MSLLMAASLITGLWLVSIYDNFRFSNKWVTQISSDSACQSIILIKDIGPGPTKTGHIC